MDLLLFFCCVFLYVFWICLLLLGDVALLGIVKSGVERNPKLTFWC